MFSISRVIPVSFTLYLHQTNDAVFAISAQCRIKFDLNYLVHINACWQGGADVMQTQAEPENTRICLDYIAIGLRQCEKIRKIHKTCIDYSRCVV